jgi:hypothetical protein
MRFKEFLEQEEIPNPTGQKRNTSPSSSPSAVKGQTKPVMGGSMSPGTQSIPDKNKPAAPIGVGGSYANWEPPKPSNMSPAIAPLQGLTPASPFSSPMKYARPKAGFMGAGLLKKQE